jgi:DNA-binding NarL/FixJ family response regulator
MRDYAKAKELLYSTMEHAAEQGALGLYYATLHYLLDIAIYTDTNEECETLLSCYDEADSDYYNIEHKRYVEAVVAAHNGDMSRAERLLDEAETTDEDLDDYYHTRYLVYRIGGDDSKAIEWLERGKSRQDMLTLSVLNQPTLNIELELLQSRLEAERTERELIAKNMEQERQLAEAERQHTRTRILWVSAMLVVAIILIIIYVRHRWQAKDRAIAQYIETIHELQMTSRDIPDEMNATITTIYRDRFSELNALCETYYDHSGSSRQKNIVFNQLSDTIESIKGDNKRLKEMEAAVNSYRNNLMQRLRDQVEKLNDRDLRVALYVFAGFSNRAIAIFIDSDPTNVSKIRYNIKQKIKSANAEDGEMIIAALSEK